MKIEPTPLEDCFVLEPEMFFDHRGWFSESFNQKTFEKAIGKPIGFVQDNQSFSQKGVLRGLHFQTGKHEQAKLVQVIQGLIQDVCVDIRKDSASFGKYFSIELSDTNRRQLFVPRGFAHGFLVLSEEALVSYKCDNYYNTESETGIIYNDPTLHINWNLGDIKPIISEKDGKLPPFQP